MNNTANTNTTHAILMTKANPMTQWSSIIPDNGEAEAGPHHYQHQIQEKESSPLYCQCQ